MHGFVAIVLNLNHTTVYANCVIACNRPKYISVQTLKVEQ